MAYLCIGFYAGEGACEVTYMSPSTSQGAGPVPKGKISAWIVKDEGFKADGLSGDLDNFVGMERWTATAADCLHIKDMANIVTIETDDL
jgi:hypothetical protein